MPASHDQSNYDRAVFRITYPHVVAYCEGGPDSIWSAELQRCGGSLSGEATVSVERNIREELAADPLAPAEEWHARWIPNGDYTVLYNGCSFDFRIHLVERGVLAGRRIVKVKQPGQNLYTGFAHVQRNGELDLWARFRRDNLSDYVSAARALLVNIAANAFDAANAHYVLERARSNRMTGVMVNAPTSLLDSDGPLVTIEWRVRQLRCLHCNTAAASLPSEFALCVDHASVPPRPRTTIRATMGVVVDTSVVGRTVSARRVRRSPSHTGASGALLSEVNGTAIR